MKLRDNVNYDVQYKNGTLYVNPNRLTARTITPTLICVEELYKDPSGYKYKAHFAYTNDNWTPVYIQSGSDNNLTSSGSFSGSSPQLFEVGGGQFDILFDGNPITWKVSSYFFLRKKTLTAEASSSSYRCQNNISNARVAETTTRKEYNLAEEIDQSVVAYPNPVVDRIHISISGMNERPANSSIQIMDQLGKQYPIRTGWDKDTHQLEVDFSDMDKGLYLVKIISSAGAKVVKVFKE